MFIKSSLIERLADLLVAKAVTANGSPANYDLCKVKSQAHVFARFWNRVSFLYSLTSHGILTIIYVLFIMCVICMYFSKV